MDLSNPTQIKLKQNNSQSYCYGTIVLYKEKKGGGHCIISRQHVCRTMEGTLLLLLGLLLALPVLLIHYFRRGAPPSRPGEPRRRRLPPGPRQLPVIGSLHHLLLLAPRHGGLLHRAVRELSSRHGPVMLLRLGAVPTLVVSSAAAAREVLRTHDAAFASRHLTPTLAVLSVGGRDILFSPYGDPWRQLRRVCVLELLSARRVRSFRRVRDEEAAALLRSVADSCGGGSAVVDVGERVCRAVNDVVVRCAVGARCPRRDEFLRELHRAVVLSAGFNLADLYPSSRLARRLSPALRDTERCNRAVRDIMADIIREQQQAAAAAGKDDGEEPEEEDNLLAVLLRLQKEDDGGGLLTTDVISTVVLEMFGAGSETSSTTLAELARNPAAMRRAQAEARAAFAGKTMLTEADVAAASAAGRLTYLPLVVKETLRLHVPVPFLLPRECRGGDAGEEGCAVAGYHVAKGTKVLVNAWAIARDPAYWGGDAEAFRPERFEEEGTGGGGGVEVDFRGGDFEFVPFGAGRRMCPGMAMGLANMELPLAGLLYHFDWTVPDGEAALDMSEEFGITVKRKHKLVLRATPRVPCSY